MIFIGEANMQAFLIGSRIYGNGTNSHFLTGADDSKGYFSSVGYKNFFKHRAFNWLLMKTSLGGIDQE
jgi:hypothetical protein